MSQVETAHPLLKEAPPLFSATRVVGEQTGYRAAEALLIKTKARAGKVCRPAVESALIPHPRKRQIEWSNAFP
jgi:hypothetical protein